MNEESGQVSTTPCAQGRDRAWRTRVDPFAADSEGIEEMLGVMPDLQAA